MAQELEESKQKSVFEARGKAQSTQLKPFTVHSSGIASYEIEDYQFVTKDQLEQLGASESGDLDSQPKDWQASWVSRVSKSGLRLVGTKFLQPYMHGFFMDYRLHAKLKAALEPFAFEEYRKQKARDNC